MKNSLQTARSVEDLRHLAKRTLPRSVFDFIDGGAEDELTLVENRRGFERLRIVPRTMVDVSFPRMDVNIAGTTANAPFLIAPMGSTGLAWPQADIAIARAAAHFGLPFTLSTMSTTSIEQLAKDVPAAHWFQLYLMKDKDLSHSLMDRAAAAGYSTLVVTVDLQAAGKRERDLRNGISLPLRFGPGLVFDALLHPGWTFRLLRNGFPQFENVRGPTGGDTDHLTVVARAIRMLDPGFDWNDLARLRERWRGPLIVKGICHPDDAERLVSCGIDGIWISNHGGRQLDGAISSIAALPHVAAAVGGRVPLILDSGVRRGVDALKARALGAHAVAVGRSVLFGASSGGEAGATRALEILLAELRSSMQLAGIASWNAVDRGLLGEQAAN